MDNDSTSLINVSRVYPELAAKIGGRPELLFAVENPARRGHREKHVIVGLYDHDRCQSLLAVMDPERQAVVEIQPAQVQFQLSEKERLQAESIASEHERVCEVLAGRPMNPLTRLYLPKGANSGNRHAIVFLRPSSSERWFAIVDLTSKSTVKVMSRRQMAGE